MAASRAVRPGSFGNEYRVVIRPTAVFFLTRVFVQVALRFIERHCRQGASIDRSDEPRTVRAAIQQVLRPARRARRQIGEIVERLVMRL
ncbi:hypothetical protein AWB69_04716 [Caballeronia udeis]|uniref:Uncharacterized protein n=1 Tax=Caballeronia udeis TaxID=1232866 RepID=A0A158HS82_9BURK|nr:hypothetical protein AWB69_04716 [Caballeronia udeis]